MCCRQGAGWAPTQRIVLGYYGVTRSLPSTLRYAYGPDSAFVEPLTKEEKWVTAGRERCPGWRSELFSIFQRGGNLSEREEDWCRYGWDQQTMLQNNGEIYYTPFGAAQGYYI